MRYSLVLMSYCCTYYLNPSYMDQDTQSERGKLFEILADITDEYGALAEMEDLESLDSWIFDVDQQTPPEEPHNVPLG